MIIGIGTDIIEIDRIRNAFTKNPEFLNRIFTLNEIDYFRLRKYNPQNIAGNFAAKEAVSKALGTGISGLKWQEIEINRKTSGEPMVILHGKATEYAKNKNINKINISISHCKEYATAVAIAESE